MKSLALTLAIVLTLCVLLFFGVRAFSVSDKVAGPLASATLGTFTFIHDKVEKALSAGKSPVTPGLVPVRWFIISSPLMLLYACLSFVAIFEVANIFSIFPTEVLVSMANGGIPDEVAIGISGLLALPTIWAATFTLGRWVGVRSAGAGYWIVPVTLVLARLIEFGTMFLLVKEARPMVLNSFSKWGFVAGLVLLGTIIAVGLLGVWRGNKVRFGAYFNSLLEQIPESSKATLLAMTFEEARASVD